MGAPSWPVMATVVLSVVVAGVVWGLVETWRHVDRLMRQVDRLTQRVDAWDKEWRT